MNESFPTPSLPTPTAPVADGRAAPAATGAASLVHDTSICSLCMYTNLGVMTATAIELAFSRQDGTLREAPDAYHRARDEGAKR